MKILIWFGCILIVAIIEVMLQNSGIMLGAIPAMILFGGMFYVAQSLCKAWDNRNKKNKEAEKPSEKTEN